MPSPDLRDRFFVLAQHGMPKQALTRFAEFVANSRAPWTRGIIPWFIRKYGVDMSEAARPDPADYACFNDFFTRALREGARPLADSPFVSPVDGTVIDCVKLDGDTLLQVKGHPYSARALVGGDAALVDRFDGGEAISIYLSPKDYHRIHMPCAGRLRRMIHVPGSLYSVNPATVAGVPGLFARNERVVCLFDSDFGPFVLTLVGAMVVGSMQTVWHGLINPPRTGKLREWRYDDQDIRLDRGEEMGRFLLGSTVVMLFPRGALQACADWVPGRTVRMGEAMADALPR
ncbi:MAG: phosphatidylserine decarboxylase [Methyloversatilis discipulorum]|uniref:archaetidylserine decarboxylase n=1 Tax=Methyloversatilis discipulorum TaxID=1119528 RepID=UPI0026F26E43|nr:archaetidylserine decarboxylase [Methyloversatilis discipulorum]MBT9516421.1 phosphatidylserine decarboxylase [Methyloversatilis discipulorum]